MSAKNTRSNFDARVPSDVLRDRRRRLMRMAGKGAAVVLSSAPPAEFSNDVEYPYRQDSDFAYLTGFPEAGAFAVLAEGECVLFCEPRDPAVEVWVGERIGCRRAVRDYGVDAAFPTAEFEERLTDMLKGCDAVYCNLGSPFASRVLSAATKTRRRGASRLIDVAPLVGRLRWKKSAREIRLMEDAAKISVDAHRRAMSVCKPGMREYELAAEIEYVFARAGARTAYPSIVGSGGNACVLHYTKNAARMKKGDLVLIDAGAEYAGYAADITRTFPVDGRFGDAQRDLYETVLEAQLAAIKLARIGHTLADVHTTAVKSLTAGLVRLGLLKGRPASLIKRGAHRRFYMHHTGHWLGMDVHDCSILPAGVAEGGLQAGAVLTVEPGLYVPAEPDIPKHWRGVGVRIEDDVLVTRGGNRVLTEDLVKRPDEIEAWMAR